MLLTAVSTVLGLIPITVTIFWGRMAIAAMGERLVATCLTLIFLPAFCRVVSHEGAPRGQLGGRSCPAPPPRTQLEPGSSGSR